MVAPSKDGCWLFVSLTGGPGGGPGMAVLKRSAGKIDLVRVVPLPSAPTGIRVTHDGKLLIAAAGSAVVFLDVQKAIKGDSDPVVGSIAGGRGRVYTNMTPDDSLLFVAEESDATITVIDLERARRDGYKSEDVIGKIPVGNAPIALTFSPDGKWLYTTSELASPDWNWPKQCKPEGAQVPLPDSVVTDPEGAVIVIDVARARTYPAHAVVARVPAACSPVRMSISSKGDRIYVTARNSNAVLEFDTAKLVPDGEHALVGIAPVGSAPVPVMAVDEGRKIVVGNSDRFAGGGGAESLVAERRKDRRWDGSGYRYDSRGIVSAGDGGVSRWAHAVSDQLRFQFAAGDGCGSSPGRSEAAAGDCEECGLDCASARYW